MNMGNQIVFGGSIDRDVFEAEVLDKTSVEEILQALADICEAKASHIRENWQDTLLEASWLKMGNRLNTLSGKAHIFKL